MAKLSINNVTLRIPIRNPADNSLKSLIIITCVFDALEIDFANFI